MNNEGHWRLLEKGEIIREGDEVYAPARWDDYGKWEPANHEIGTPAPDPRFPAHRMYRRATVCGKEY